jgi:hypothetical protein
MMFNAFRDFADGLTRGLSLFFTERNDFTVKTTMPASRRDPSKPGRA